MHFNKNHARMLAMPSFTLLTKKKKEAPAFSWIGDPADSIRGRSKISRADMQQLYDYNRRLIAPIDRPSDRGGDAPYWRVNGQPVGFAGQASPAAPEQWQQPLDRAGIARITRARGGIDPLVRAPLNPNLGPGGPMGTTVGGPTEEPPLTNVTTRMAASGTPSSPIPTGGIAETSDAAAATAAAAGIPLRGASNSLVGAETEPEGYQNPSLSPIPESPTNPNHAVGPTGPVGPSGEAAPPSAGADVRNPNTGAPIAKTPQQQEAERHAMWLASGGSDHTYHEAQVAQGVRPAIDGRAKPDPLASNASADIRAGWGWGATPEENASQIHDQMTSDFNKNNRVAQTARRKLFSDAHAALMKSLSDN
ncbi:MAG: hypothetical protein WBD81_17880 [Collimonas pratensis]